MFKRVLQLQTLAINSQNIVPALQPSPGLKKWCATGVFLTCSLERKQFEQEFGKSKARRCMEPPRASGTKPPRPSVSLGGTQPAAPALKETYLRADVVLCKELRLTTLFHAAVGRRLGRHHETNDTCNVEQMDATTSSDVLESTVFQRLQARPWKLTCVKWQAAHLHPRFRLGDPATCPRQFFRTRVALRRVVMEGRSDTLSVTRGHHKTKLATMSNCVLHISC